MLVLEITEHERVTDMPLLRQAIDAVHACGARMALDDFGDGRSSLRLWSEVKPDFVKIDKYFIREISDRPDNLQMLQAIKGIADVFGTTLIAEGIETRDDLRALRDLDIPFGQGWLLGRPALAPRDAVDGPALEVLHDRRVAVLPHLGQTARPGILRSLLVVQAPTAAPATMIEKYGPANGFGWNLNETIGIQVVSVPLSLPLARADKAWWTVMAMLTGVFVVIGLTLNLMLWKLVIQPVTRLSALADRVSMGEMEAPEFSAPAKDEIGVLSDSFSRMRKSLQHAMKLLEG